MKIKIEVDLDKPEEEQIYVELILDKDIKSEAELAGTFFHFLTSGKMNKRLIIELLRNTKPNIVSSVVKAWNLNEAPHILAPASEVFSK